MKDPIFVVAPPRSGGLLLAEAFTRSPGVVVARDALAHALPAREPLTESDATPELVSALHEAVARVAGDARLLDASPSHALRVPFLHAVFPGATFVYIYREPRRAIWDMGGSGTAEELAQRWKDVTTQLLDDLERLPPERWMVAAYRAVTEHPDNAIARIADFLAIAWDGTVPPSPSPQETPQHQEMERLDAVDAITRPVADRARDLFAAPPPRAHTPSFRSVSTNSFPQILQRLGVSLIVSTYQSGRLILVRAESATSLNTHFRMFQSPMGIAVGNGRLAIGTAREV